MKTNLLLVSVFASWITVAVASDKQRNIAAALSTLGAIEHVAQLESETQKTTPDPGFKGRIHDEVRKLCDPLGVQELAIVAVACSAIYYPGNANDVGYDEPFYAAFWCAVSKLAAQKTDANYRALLFVKERSHLVGGERTGFDEVLATFPKELNKPQ